MDSNKKIEQTPSQESPPTKQEQSKEAEEKEKSENKVEQQAESDQEHKKESEEQETQAEEKPQDEGGGLAQSNNLNQERKKKIDNILSEGLSDIYLNLPKGKQKEFKKEGERTRNKINELFKKGEVKLKKIIFLIKKWLGLIPKANKYYLEQEAKIKAEKIIDLKKY